MSLRRSKGRKAVQDRGPDLQFGHRPVDVARHHALIEQLEAVHFWFDQAWSGVKAPILFLTAIGGIDDRVGGQAGADDYLVKPFAFAEVLARVQARRPPPAARRLWRKRPASRSAIRNWI